MASIRQQDVVVPHFSVPFQLGATNGAAFLNEQDSTEDIIDSIKAVLSYPPGSHDALPGFGVEDLVFRQRSITSIASQLQAALREWEPRSEALVSENPAILDELVRKIVIKVRGDN